MLTFHAIGNWPPGHVTTAWGNSSLRIPPDVVLLIEDAWADARTRLGEKLFDGPMCRMESWHVTEDQLDLVLSRTSYKIFLGTNLHHAEVAARFGPQALANPVGLSAALISADGFLLLGRRSDTVAYYPHRTHPFAGTLEPSDQPDVFKEVQRELSEELGLSPADLSDLHCVGMIEDRAIRHPELVFIAQSKRTRQEIERGLDAKEHMGVLAIPGEPAETEKALADLTLFTPVAVGTILLAGRERFGGDWFDRMCRRILSGEH